MMRLVKLHVTLYLLRNKYVYSQDRALNILADFIVKYIQKAGMRAKSLAQMSLRNEVNIFQALYTLDTALNLPIVKIERYMKRQSENSDRFGIHNMVNDIFGDGQINNNAQVAKVEQGNLVLSRPLLSIPQLPSLEKDQSSAVRLPTPIDQIYKFPDEHTYQETQLNEKQFITVQEFHEQEVQQRLVARENYLAL